MTKLKDLEKSDRELLMRGETEGLSSEGQEYYKNLPEEKKEFLLQFKSGTPYKKPTLESPIPAKETTYADKQLSDLSTILQSGVFQTKDDLKNFLSKQTGRNVFFDESGRPVFREQGTKYSALPDYGENPLKALLRDLPDIAESIPSTVAGITTAPFGPAVSIPVTGFVGGASDATRQAISRSLLDSDRPIDIGQAIRTGSVDAGLQAVPFVGKKIYERLVPPDVERFANRNQVAKLDELSDKYNIRLTPAEKTNLESLIAQQYQLENLPQTSTIMKESIRDRQTGEILPNIDKVIADIAGRDMPQSRYRIGIKAQSDLDNYLQGLKTKRKTEVANIYDEAKKIKTPIQTEDAVKKIDYFLDTAKGNQRSILQNLKNEFYEPLKKVSPDKAKKLKNDIRSLNQSLSALDPSKEDQKVIAEDIQKQIQNLSKELDSDVLDDRVGAVQNLKFYIDSKMKDKTFDSLDAVVQGQIQTIKKSVTDALQTNPKMALADKKFAELSVPIDEFQDKLGGVARTPDTTIDNFIDRYILQAEPEQINYLKNILKSSDPVLWKNIKGRVLQGFYEKASKVNPKAPENLRVGSTFGNLLKGDPNTVRVLKTTFDKREFEALQDFATLLQATGRVPQVGSKTQFNKVAQDILMRPTFVGSTLKKLSLDIFPRIGQAYDDFVADLRVKDVANTILSEDGMEKLKELRKVKPGTVKYTSLASQILANFINQKVLDEE